MWKFLFSLVLANSMWGSCSGDCMSCHSGLDFKNDKRHIPMTTCKTCHTEEKMASIQMGGGCGQDCFACHDIGKIRAPHLKNSHKIIDSCISCHKGLSNSVFKNNLNDPTGVLDRKNFQDFSEVLNIIK